MASSEEITASVAAVLDLRQQEVADASLKAQRALDPGNPTTYATYDEYVAETGRAGTGAVNYFNNRIIQEQQAQDQLAMSEALQRDNRAFATTPELYSNTGTAKQLAASSIVGINRGVGFLAQAVPATISEIQGLTVSGENQNLLNQEASNKNAAANLSALRARVGNMYQSGEMSREDVGTITNQLDLAQGAIVPLTEEEKQGLDKRDNQFFRRWAESASPREAMAASNKNAETAASISDLYSESESLNGISNANTQNPLLDSLSENYDDYTANFAQAETSALAGDYSSAAVDTMAGVAGLIGKGIGSLIDNPQATFSYLAENLPDLAIGALSKTAMAAVNMAYATDIYTKSLAEHKKVNNGVAPTKNEKLAMLAISLSAGALENLGELKMLSGIKKLEVLPGATAAVNTATNRVFNLGANIAKGTAKVAGTGFVEAGTEMYQTAVEENFSKLNTDVDGKNIYTAGVIGFGVGATLTGGSKTLQALTPSASTGGPKRTTINDALGQKEQDAYDSLAEAADPAKALSVFNAVTDPKNAAYRPAAAVRFLANKLLNTEQTPEERATTKEQIAAIDVAYEAERKAYNAEYKALSEAIKATKDPAEIEAIDEKLNVLADQYASFEHQRQAIAKYKDTINSAENPKLAEIDAIVTEATVETASPERDAAVSKTITLLMQNPGAVTDEHITRLEASQVLTPEQSEYVTNYKATHAAANELQGTIDVTGDVMNGRNGFRGIGEYRLSIAEALQAGDLPKADAELANLRAFYADHNAKRKALKEAIDLSGGQQNAYAIKDPSAPTGWVVTTTEPKNYNRAQNGGFIVYKNAVQKAESVLSAIGVEVKALEVVGKELAAAVALSSPASTQPSVDLASLEGLDLIPSANAQANGIITNTATDTAQVQGAAVQPVAVTPETTVTTPDTTITPSITSSESEVAALTTTEPKVSNEAVVATPEQITTFNKLATATAQSEAAVIRAEAAGEPANVLADLNDQYSADNLAANAYLADNPGSDSTKAAPATAVATPVAEKRNPRIDKILKAIETEEHHTRGDRSLKAFAAMQDTGEFVVYVDDKPVLTVPLDPRILEKVADIYEINLAYWAERKRLGLDDFAPESDALQAMSNHTEEVGDFYQELSEVYLSASEKPSQVDPTKVENGTPFTQGNFKWANGWASGVQTKLGETFFNGDPGICFGCANATVRALRKAGLPATVAHMGQLDPSGKTQDNGDHQVAVTDINGVSYIVDQPQRELWKPLSPPQANKGTVVKEDFTPRFILNTPAGIHEAYGNALVSTSRTDKVLPERGAVTYGNSPMAPAINDTIESLLERFGLTGRDQKANTKTPTDTAKTVAEGVAVEPQAGVETTTPATPLENGGLLLINNETVLAEENDPDNLLASDFEQAGATNPLFAIKDFMAALFAGTKPDTALIERFLEKGQTLTPEAAADIFAFNEFLKEAGPTIEANLDPSDRDPQYRHRDFMQFFGGELDQNMITAIAAAAYTWLGENGEFPNPTDADVRRMFGIEKGQNPTKSQRILAQELGFAQSQVVQDLGQRVASMLSIKAKQGVAANYQTQLELSFGTHVLFLLIDMDVVTRSVSNDQQLMLDGVETDGSVDINQQEYPEALTEAEKAKLASSRAGGKPFIKVVGVSDTDTANIVDDRKRSGGILTNLFKVDGAVVFPATTSGSYIQKKIRNSLLKVPKYFRKIAVSASKRKHVIRERMKLTRAAFDSSRIEQMAGIEALDDTGYIHDARVESISAKNEGIRRGIKEFNDYESNFIGEFFYTVSKLWSNQRAGQESSVINTQTDKFQRSNVSMAEWSRTIDTKKNMTETEIRNDPVLSVFFLSVAQGLGLNVDKDVIANIIPELSALMANDPVMVAAIAALQNATTLPEGQTLSEAEQNAVVSAVLASGENFHSLDALVSWATYKTAAETGTSFDTDIAFEVDGVNNGPAFVQILLGTLLPDQGAQAGFFNGPDSVTSTPEYKSTIGNLDMYEDLAAQLSRIISSLGDKERQSLAPIFQIAGELLQKDQVSKAARKLAKSALTPIVFGSSVNKTLQNMAEAFQDQFYKALEKAANEQDERQVLFLIQQMNILLGQQNALILPTANSNESIAQQAMKLTLSFKQAKVLEARYTRLMGDPVKSAIETKLATFMERRTEQNDAAEMAWDRYEVAYELLYKAKLDKLIYSGEIKTSDSIPDKKIRDKINATLAKLTDLSKEELAAKRTELRTPYLVRRPNRDLTALEIKEITDVLKDLEPIAHTAMSKMDGDLRAGVNVGKTNFESVNKEDVVYGRPYSAEVQKNKSRSFPSGSNENQAGKKYISSLATAGRRIVRSTPGVRSVIVLTHAMDSYIAATVYGKYPALNVHDGIYFGNKDVTPGSTFLNETTYKVLVDYSIPLELSDMLSRSFEAEAALLATHPMAEELKKAFDSLALNENIQRDVRANALLARAKQLTFMLQVDNVNQYAFEGGHYSVTAADKANIATLLAAVEAELKPLLSAQAAEAKASKAAVVQSKTAQKAATKTAPPTILTTEDTPWGIVGESANSPDQNLLTILETFATTGSTPAQNRELLAGLYHYFNKAPGRVGQFKQDLLGLLGNNRLDLDALTIVLVRKDTPATKEAGALQNAHGGIVLKEDGSSTIYIKGPEFADSNISTELLLHELTHSSVARVVARLENAQPGAKRPTAEKIAYKAVQELKVLHEKAKAFVAENNLENEFGPAVENLQETIAWGMTNTPFQTQVLAKIKMQVSAATNQALQKKSNEENGLRFFIRQLTQVFFKNNPTSSQENGMGVLIANTGLLVDRGTNTAKAKRKEIILKMASTQPATFTSRQIFEALGKVSNTAPLSPEVAQRLQELLVSVTNAVYGPGGALKAEALRTAPMNAEQIFIDSLANGTLPFAYRLQAEVNMTEQESFVAESLDRTFTEVFNATSLVDPMVQARKRELRKIWDQAKAEITPADFYTGPGVWADASEADIASAERAWNAIFTPQGSTPGMSNHLTQFAAAALTYQPLYNKLATIMTTTEPSFGDANTLIQKIQVLAQKAFNIITRMVSGAAKSERLATAVTRLARDIATAEAKRKTVLEDRKNATPSYINEKLKQANEGLKQGVAAVAEKGTESGIKAIRALSQAITLVAGERGEELSARLRSHLRSATGERNSLIESIINEVDNGNEALIPANKVLDAASSMQRSVVALIDQTKAMINESYKKHLVKADSVALTQVLLRTDMSALMPYYNMAELQELTSNPAALETAIRAFEDKIVSPHRRYYLVSSKALGFFMARGKVTVHNLMLNAHNIAYLGNTDKAFTEDVAELAARAAAVKELDPLISLYALRWTSKGAKKAAARIMSEENLREQEDQGNGPKVTLIHHLGMQKEALNRIFDGNPISMQKGYVKDLLNPRVELVTATDKEGALLLKAGYILITTDDLAQDQHDPNRDQKRKLYYNEYGGLAAFVPGAISNIGRKSAGFTSYGASVDPTAQVLNSYNAKLHMSIQAGKAESIAKMFAADENFDPETVKASLMAPVLGHDGYAANWRYMMQDSTKDTVMKRNNMLGQVMGGTVGSMHGKAESPGLNRRGIDVLKSQYDREYLTNPKDFVDFSETSKDPAIRERYKLLPDDTKRYIRDVFGKAGMQVHRNVYDINFGYRKFSLAEMFQADAVRNSLEQSVYNGMTLMLGAKAGRYVANTEELWQTAVTMIKDARVIKSIMTLTGNETSNATVLQMFGVPLKNIATDKIVAINAAMDYLRDLKEQDKLKMMVKYGHVVGQGKTDSEIRIIDLEEALVNSPIRPLVDGDMLQTLVEDIDTETDGFSFKSRFDQWAADKTANLPQGVKSVANTAFMTHDSAIYKFLHRSTILSDFTSRYVLHKHLTTRAKNPLSNEEALQTARQAFVNYDVPTHKNIQYMNDMGILWFTKYYLRIQAVIFSLVKENPAGALALIAANGLIEFPDITDSNALTNSPLNFGAGAFEAPGAIMNIPTVGLVRSVF